MKNIDRKEFFKKACLSGACLCGFGSVGLSNGTGNAESDSRPNAEKKDVRNEWLAVLLSNISKELNEKQKRKILTKCASAHYEDLGMDKILEPYRNDLDRFLAFLEDEWDWKIDYDKETGTILADENKSYCVCPVINDKQKPDQSSMCYCSEGFAELMFSYVTGVSASATVVSSIHRGNDRCIYRIVVNNSLKKRRLI